VWCVAADGLEESTSSHMRLVAGEKAVSPEQFYRYPSTAEVEQFVPMGKGSSNCLFVVRLLLKCVCACTFVCLVQRRLQEACDEFPTAHGLVIAFSNEIGCEESKRVHNIHTSSKNVCKAFSNLGYATCSFKVRHVGVVLLINVGNSSPGKDL